MLSQEDNMRMCLVGENTPMGNALRRYWIPALLAEEVEEPDGDPVRFEILGEKLVAFRDTKGRLGILDEKCCHRGASLYLARNEECGLRCLYHGWKYAYDGEILETPNIKGDRIKEKHRHKSYPSEEAGGIIWVYMGPPELKPKFKRFPWMNLPKENIVCSIHFEECNYVQVTEGLLDSTHLGFLHSDGLNRGSEVAAELDIDYGEKVGEMLVDLAPDMEAEETQFGFHYAALRENAAEGNTLARITSFVAPFIVLNPNGDIATIMVPMNNYQTHFIHVFWSEDKKLGIEPLRSEQLEFVGLNKEHLDKYGISRKTFGSPQAASIHNRFMQDRDAMRAGKTFSGLPGLIEEDIAVVVSAGVIRDRRHEKLVIADIGIQRLYFSLLKLAKQVEDGEIPTGLGDDVDYSEIVGVTGNIEKGEKWQKLAPGHRKPKATKRQVAEPAK